MKAVAITKNKMITPTDQVEEYIKEE